MRDQGRHPPTVLAFAFRPFFLLAAGWMVVSMGLWLLSFSGADFAPMLGSGWHAHEMLFAVVAAAAAGFALTAVANWTGTPPVSGWPLAGLIVLWLAGRLLLLADASPPALTGAVNVSFLVATAGLLWRRLAVARNRRNYPLVAIFLLLASAQGIWHFTALDPGLAFDVALLTVAAMVSLIGGRITPAFTRNWLKRQQLEETVRESRVLESVNVGAALLAALMMLLSLLHPVASKAAGMLALLAGLAGLLRLAGWNGLRVLSEPLLWVLHLAWLWLTAALLLAAATQWGWSLPETLWLHVLGAGAIGTILMGVMTRVALGHTGRPLTLPRGAAWLYALITLAALTRIFAVLAPTSWWLPLLALSGGLWMLAWLGYLLFFGPILLTPRPDGRPG